MLKLILCDDDQFTLRLAAGLIHQAIQICQVEAQICCIASSGSELLNYLQNANGPFLYFLDYDFGQAALNGIDLVKCIYQRDADAKIVFVTSHGDKGMDILKSGIRAFGFVEKTPDTGRMVAEYVKYLQMAAPEASPSETVPRLTLPLGIDETVELSIPDIAYVDSVKSVAHTICYHTFDGSAITVRDTIEHAKELLGEDFIRCHRSVLINRRHAVSVTKGLVRLSNGETVACALSKRKEIAALCFSNEKGGRL